MGDPRHTGSAGRLRRPMGEENGDQARFISELDGSLEPEIPGLATSLRQGQRAQSLGAARSLAGELGKGGHCRVQPRVSVGRISAIVFHDARSRHCRRQSIECVSGSEGSGISGARPRQVFAQRQWFRATLGPSRSLAHRLLLCQCRRDVLLPVQRSRRMLTQHHSLGDTGVDERKRCGNRPATGAGKTSSSPAPDHLGQRPTIHIEGFQGIPSAVANRTCSDQPVLSGKQRQTRTVSPNAQGSGHPAQDPIESGGCPADRGRVRGLLQPGSVAQCLGLRKPARSLGRSSYQDLRRAGPETGGSPGAATQETMSNQDQAMKKVLEKGKASSTITVVDPEDRALQGSNPSAAIDSNTAGLGEEARPGRPPAGSISKRKIPGGLGDRVPQVQSSPSSSSQTKKTNGISALVSFSNRRFSLNQYRFTCLRRY